ncbi:MAG: ATP-binding protein [Janthinobacterium lividum]
MSLTADLARFVSESIISGEYRTEDDVLCAALRLLRNSRAGQEADPPDDAFLLRLADHIGRLKIARLIMADAIALLGGHLAASRVGYAEITKDGEHFNVREDWSTAGMPDRIGQHRLDDFGPRLVMALRGGATVAFTDAAAEPMVQQTPAVAAAFAALHTQAAILVPLVKGGQLEAVLYVHQNRPRDWSAADRRLVREVADRTWAAVERARSEATLVESEARFRTLADAMPQMIWVFDPQGATRYCNARFLDFTGAPGGLPGIAWPELVHPDDRADTLEALRETLLSGLPFEREHRLRRFDGVYRWVLARALPVLDPAGGISAWFGTSTDITDLVDARHVLRQSRDELERLVAERTRALTDAAHELAAEMLRREELQSSILQSQKLEALGQLTSGVAHDFNNVLAAISGSYDLIRRRAEAPGILEIVQRGEQAVDRASKLIGTLLAFVRREKLTPRLLDLPQLLEDARDLIQHAIGADMRCAFDVPARLHPVLADPYQLEIAILNLVVNARDAMGRQGLIVIAARNRTAAECRFQPAHGDYVVITVRDTGQGMPPDVLARATDAFFTTKPEGQGTGLGLAMVSGFASRSGGGIHIESEPGAGTAVDIVIPRAPIDGEADPVAGAPGPDPGLHGDATLLLVDDDDQFRQITAAFLRELGYHVLEAANAETASALAHTLPRLDLLLTDEDMPGATGRTLVGRLRADWPGLPVQFLTGSAPDARLVGEAVLRKPFQFAALSAAVLERLGRWTPPGGAPDRLLKRLKTPALRQFYLNWQTARIEAAGLPTRSSLDPVHFGLGPHAFTIAIDSHAPLRFRFLTVGAALSMRLGRPLDGVIVEAVPEDEELLGNLHATYRRCVQRLSPVYQAARLDFGDGPPLHLERLVLPVSDDAETVTHLVGISLFNETAIPCR